MPPTDVQDRLGLWVRFNEAMIQLIHRHGGTNVLEMAREWVDYMDRQVATIEAYTEAQQSDGEADD